ncbi:pali-domain-containing protein [Ceratobasidium sp. AG-I]|nr:pali-domain-containing protein [Ceratobasidium sp. AG-I]
MISPTLPTLLFCVVACILLVIATVSVPLRDDVSFFDISLGGREVHFGVFGYTGSEAKLGYKLDQSVLGINTDEVDIDLLNSLSYVLVLHPIAAAFAGLVAAPGLFGAASSRTGSICMSVMAGLAMLCTFVALVTDLVMWSLPRSKLRALGVEADYGNANWIVLGAFGALIVGFCTSVAASCARHRRHKADCVICNTHHTNI